VQALKQRISRDLTIFKGQFTQYDLFNELVSVPSMLDHCNMRSTILRDAFHWARAADPSAELCLNEWGVLDTQNWQDFLDLIRELQQGGVPIACIGVQAHLMRDSTSPEAMWQRLNQLASTGLPIYITEFSLSSKAASRFSTATRTSILTDAQQSNMMKQLVTLWFSHPAIRGITMWGFWDGHISNKGGGIFRADGSPKPAADMLTHLWRVQWNTTLTNAKLGVQKAEDLRALGGQQMLVTPAMARRGALSPANVANAASAPAVLQFRGYYGQYGYELFANGRRYSGKMQLTEGSPAFVRIQLPNVLATEG
jgi:hypothetical protein